MVGECDGGCDWVGCVWGFGGVIGVRGDFLERGVVDVCDGGE